MSNSFNNKVKGELSNIRCSLRAFEIIIMESLILAQNERWRCVLSMQVERQEGACTFLEWRTGE